MFLSVDAFHLLFDMFTIVEQQLEPFLYHLNAAIDSIPEDSSMGLKIAQYPLLLQVKREEEACYLMDRLYSQTVNNSLLYRYDVILKTITFHSKCRAGS